MSPGFFVFSFFSVLITSVSGMLCNTYLLVTFLSTSSKPNGFRKLSTLRSLTNTLLCAAFCFWVIPLTAANFTLAEVNNWANRLIGMVSCTWAYILNSLLQVCLSCNRFYVLYFPFGVRFLRSKNFATYVIVLCITGASIFSVFTLRTNCSLIFDPNLFLWRCESSECPVKMFVIIPRIVITTTAITHWFNLLIVIKLIKREKALETGRRTRRWMISFGQCIAQDCLQLIDMLNYFYFSPFSDDLRLQFLTWTLSLITITLLDGLVMFICHREVHPVWLKKRFKM